MQSNLEEKIMMLEQDTIHGAHWLSKRAIEILKEEIEKNEYKNIVDFIKGIEYLAYRLKRARAGMVSVNNYIELALNKILRITGKYSRVHVVQFESVTICNGILRKIDKIPEYVSSQFIKLLNKNEIIITCSYSSLVCEALKRAKSERIKLKLYICESKVNNIQYGSMIADEIGKYKINYSLINDNLIHKYIKKCSMAITGADAILSCGDIINGTPSLRLASLASLFDVPYYVISENAKFDIKNLLSNNFGSIPGFDRINFHAWKRLITESDIIEPVLFSKYFQNLQNIFK